MARRPRPTFSESWYRVAPLRPRLHPAVQVYRQEYRGKLWHVVHDPANNQFFRVDDAGYEFIGLLDGRRQVSEAWQIVAERLGDAAPTQGEAIQLLGQLYTSNLLQGDLPADAAGMFERRRKRVQREVRGYLTNLMFIRFPLWDPDRMLARWVSVVGWVFGPVGLVLWLVLIVAGFSHLTGRWGELFEAADPQFMLRTENLLILYGCYAVIKLVHELGHAFSCKHFGREARGGGEVHTIGLMLLVFMPVPYVDASSSWAFRSKYQRAIVAGAGVFVELALAAIAAIVWARTPDGSLTHDIAFNVLFLSSISTILFNGNPLLRYDGYYVLSDLIETPNLANRSKQYLHYLVRRFALGVREATTNVRSATERAWFIIYGLASSIYRVVIFAGILFYVADQLFFIGTIMAIFGVVTWGVVPVVKYVHYLLTSAELQRCRQRAIGLSVGVVGLVGGAVGLIPVPDHQRAEGYVESQRMVRVFTEEGGVINSVHPDGHWIDANGPPLFSAHDEELAATIEQLLARREAAIARMRLAATHDPAEAQIHLDQVRVVDRQMARARQRLDRLTVKSPISGLWIARDIDKRVASHVEPGEALGFVVDPQAKIVRVVADQHLGPRLEAELSPEPVAEIRPFHRPDMTMRGRVEQIMPSGNDQLPSPALSLAAGGSTRVDMQDEQGRRAAEPFFEVLIKPLEPDRLLCGQRVVVRFALADKPLAAQWWLMLRQLLQQRFEI